MHLAAHGQWSVRCRDFSEAECPDERWQPALWACPEGLSSGGRGAVLHREQQHACRSGPGVGVEVGTKSTSKQ